MSLILLSILATLSTPARATDDVCRLDDRTEKKDLSAVRSYLRKHGPYLTESDPVTDPNVKGVADFQYGKVIFGRVKINESQRADMEPTKYVTVIEIDQNGTIVLYSMSRFVINETGDSVHDAPTDISLSCDDANGWAHGMISYMLADIR